MARTTSIEGSILALLETDPGQKGLTHFQLREFETTMYLREPERKLQQESGHLHARTSASIECHPLGNACHISSELVGSKFWYIQIGVNARDASLGDG